MVIFNGPLSEMFGTLNQSQNYIWNAQSDNDCLGEGTFGKVYCGINKRTGDKVAVKMFKHVNQQESTLLQQLKHQYIIQLIAIELDKSSNNWVMIMELCNSGSLMNFLNEPENGCGLWDEEFLLVMEHLTGGLEYLKKHNVIHRDVKPDNIMRHVHDDGRVIYKLADFGTARELPEGQTFYSLHGTEPYLNPKLFKVCFFQDPQATRKFGADTDLWSIGVTLYQTATGNLPFRVQDRHVMLGIYNEMQQNQGIISAEQRRNSDQVEYKKKLPKESRLSLGLKELITPIIAGLFTQDERRQWSFMMYYEEVAQLLARRKINVFYVNRMQMLQVYVKRDETFDDFKQYLLEQTGVKHEYQVLLYSQTLIVNCFDDFGQIDSECVFLFDRSNTDVEPCRNFHLVFENLSNFQPKFMSNTDPFEDRSLVNIACRDLCFCKNLMDYQSTVYKYFYMFIKEFKSYCKEEQDEQQKVYYMLLDKNSDASRKIGVLERLQQLNETTDQSFIEDFQASTEVFVTKGSKLLEDLASIKTDSFHNTTHDSYLRIVEKELSDFKKMRNSLGNITSKQLYNCEKLKIIHCVRTIMEILTDKMDPNFERFVKDVKEWYLNEFFSQIRILSNLKRLMNDYKKDLKKFEEDVDKRINDSLETVTKPKKSSFDKKKMLTVLEKYKQNSLDMKSVIEENLRLMNQITELIVNLKVDMSVDE